MNIFSNYFSEVKEKDIFGLTDELKAIFISQKYKKENKNILVLVNSLYEASKIYQKLLNYEKNVLFFPMDDFITSEVLAVSPEFKLNRLNTLNSLYNGKYIVVTNLMGFLRYLPSKELFKSKYIKLKTNNDYKFEDLINKLYELGYEKEVIVTKSGQMAIRGFVLDVFPINETKPIRLEFWGDTLDAIKSFSLDSQLTICKLQEITIMPNTEFLSEKCILKEKQRELVDYTNVVNITDYCNDLVIYINSEDLNIGNKNLNEEIVNYCLDNSLKIEKPFMNNFLCYNYDINLSDFGQGRLFNSNEINIKYEDLEKNLSSSKTYIICLGSRYQANNILEVITNKNKVFTNEEQIFPNYVNVIVKKIDEGFTIDDLVVISENDLFGRNKNQSYKNNLKIGTKIKDITKINAGDYVVHSMYGIARYCGIKTITKNNLKKDYLQLEYKDNDKLYIPVEKIDLITKYSIDEGHIPKVNKLGSLEWEKTKLRSRKRAHDMAFELLNMYATRKTVLGFAFNKDDENQINFEKEFSYAETPDQIKVTEEIKKDMESNHPMDRLLCGDVGYGKTEVAFRAAFKAILSGKQVAMLCPTTILSNQHYLNALERFKSFPVNIKLLNRFTTNKEADLIMKSISEGKVDFVIGTHKILNSQIKFKDLGLLIIDEEQRFGVAHKEKIKNYKNSIDVLTLSATPIPRTLQLSLANIRSLSLLETPPTNRFPIQTYVTSRNNNIIKEAIYKELSRKGQVFVLYNRIDGIESKALEINNLVKEARVAYAHGRMKKEEIENIMLDFIDYKYDVLVCTTIIESGIDIPNVNTLIVMDSNQFGLSQLYQIRGRVGRGNKIAYCYLLYDSNKVLTELATKRLKAIKEFTELGSGFSIAMRDLAIRGAGNILGDEQAGFIDSVGVDLFIQMLNEEVAKLNGTYVEKKETNKALIDVTTSISDDYVKDEELKIIIHKKISEIDSESKLEEVKRELEDRFGRINEDITIYMYEQLFEHMANNLNIKNILQSSQKIEIIFEKETTDKINGEKLFMDSLNLTKNLRFTLRGGHLVVTLDLNNLKEHYIYILVKLLEIVNNSFLD